MDLIIKILLFIICTVVIYFLYVIIDEINFINSNEYFDAKINYTTQDKCMAECKNIIDCEAIAFDRSICYLSKVPIEGIPSKSLYSKDYKTDMIRCNKIENTDKTDISSIKANATFLCSNDEQSDIIYTVSKKDDSSMIIKKDEYGNIDMNLLDVKNNHMKYNWPTDTNSELVLNNKNVEPIKKNNILSNTQIDKIYVKNDNMNSNGTYIKNCRTNIDRNICLQECSSNNDCTGIEWNSSYTTIDDTNKYISNIDVCCQMDTVKELVPRTGINSKYKNGEFYSKIKIDNIKEESLYVCSKQI